MKAINPVRAAGVLAVLALAVPASASALPSVTSVDAKTGDAGVTFLTDPTGASLTTVQRQYVVSTDGYAVAFKDDNGVRGSGVIDYSVLPTEYRAPMTAEDKRTYGPAQTDVQPHATCSGVAALADGPTILSWQTSARSTDPYYNYVPWQKTSAGLGDDPRTWLPVVRTATRVDLSTLATAADFRAACERLSGTYQAADTQSPIAATLIANALVPLQAQIDRLTRDNATIRRARDRSDAAAATARDAQRLAEATYQALFTKPIDLTLAAKRFAPNAAIALVTGSPTDPVSATLEVTKKQRRALRLASRVLATADGELDANGAVLLTFKLDRTVTTKLARHRGAVPVTVNAVSGGTSDRATAKLTH